MCWNAKLLINLVRPNCNITVEEVDFFYMYFLSLLNSVLPKNKDDKDRYRLIYVIVDDQHGKNYMFIIKHGSFIELWEQGSTPLDS